MDISRNQLSALTTSLLRRLLLMEQEIAILPPELSRMVFSLLMTQWRSYLYSLPWVSYFALPSASRLRSVTWYTRKQLLTNDLTSFAVHPFLKARDSSSYFSKHINIHACIHTCTEVISHFVNGRFPYLYECVSGFENIWTQQVTNWAAWISFYHIASEYSSFFYGYLDFKFYP